MINGKADKVHKHDITDVNNLQTALDGKADKEHNHDSVYSKLGHTHEDILNKIAANESKHTLETYAIDKITGYTHDINAPGGYDGTIYRDTQGKVSSVEAVIQNKAGTKKYNLPYRLNFVDDGDMGYTEVTITLDTTLELEGPDEWYVYSDGDLMGTAQVKHQYYRNSANDDKYITQEVNAKITNEENYDIIFNSVLYSTLQNKLQKMIDYNGGYWYIGVLSDKTNKGMASKTLLTQAQMSKWGFHYCSSNCGYNMPPIETNDNY